MPLIRVRHDDRWVLLSSGSPTAMEWPWLPPVWREIDKRGPQTSPSREASGFSLLSLPLLRLDVLSPMALFGPWISPFTEFLPVRTTQHSL